MSLKRLTERGKKTVTKTKPENSFGASLPCQSYPTQW